MNEADIDCVIESLKSEPLMYQVLIHLALNTGCRRGELIVLKWQNIDFDNNAVLIWHSAYKLKDQAEKLTEPKRGSYRRIAIPTYLINLLYSYRKAQTEYRLKIGDKWQGDDWLFIQWDGKEMNITTPSHWWPDFLKRNKLTHVKFHSLRHTSGTLALKDGADIKAVAARLGHKN